MKVGAVSGDLVVRLALVAAGLALAVYLYRRAQNAAGELVGGVLDQASEVADYVIQGVNPLSPENFAYSGVNAVGGALVSDTGPGRNADGSWSVGAWLYDVTHPDPVHAAGTSSGSTAVFEPSSEELTAASAAAFGWYPQLGRGTSADVRTIATRGRVVGGL